MRIFDSKAILRFTALPGTSTALGIGLAFYFAYNVSRFHLANVWPLRPIGDASIIFEQARLVYELGDYPARLETWRGVFAYPPSAVLIFHWLGGGGPALFMALWFAAMAAGLVATLSQSLAGERREIGAAWLAVAMTALIVADNPVSWDLRNSNSNLVWLGLIATGYALIGRLPLLAGVTIGLSIALKPYGGLLLLWLVLSASWRTLLAATATLILLALAWPIAAWGPGGAVQIYFGWLEQLKIIADPQVHATLAASLSGPPLVSLDRGAMFLTGEGPRKASTLAVVAAMQATWIAALSGYAWRAARPCPAPSRPALADWTMLMLAPLPFSPWLEPYHAVPMMLGAMLLVVIVVDHRVSARDRQIAIAAFAARLMTCVIDLPFALRGPLLLVRFLLMAVALGHLRPRLEALAGEAKDGSPSAPAPANRSASAI